MLRAVMGIDPSINVMGYALVTKDAIIYSGTLRAPEDVKTQHLASRVQYMLWSLRNVMNEGKPDEVVVERPKMWGGKVSEGANNSESLLILSTMVGALVGMFYEASPDLPVRLPTPSNWKGDLPKHITQRKVKEHYGYEAKSDHEADAIGIALWQLGF